MPTHDQKARDNKTCLKLTNRQKNLLNTAVQKTDMKNKYGAQPGCITVYVTTGGGVTREANEPNRPA